MLLCAGLLVSFAFATSYGYAADVEYYVDDATGNDGGDGHDGTSAALAWKTIQYACDNVAVSGTNGDYSRINVKNTNTYVITATIDVDTVAATAFQPIILQGYTSTIGDGGYAIIDGDDGAPDAVSIFNVAQPYYVFRHLQMQESTGDVMSVGSAGDYAVVAECKVLGGGGSYGIVFGAGCTAGTAVGNEVNCGSSVGIYLREIYSRAVYNYVHDNSGIGIYSGDFAMIMVGNIVDTTGSYSIAHNESTQVVLENTCYNATGDNHYIGNTSSAILCMNNIFSEATDKQVDMDGTSSAFSVYGYNNIWDSGTPSATHYEQVDLGGQIAANPDFEDPGNKDFNLDSDELDDDGYPATWLGADTVSHNEMGAVPYEETAGGGTTVHATAH
jgi:hypothetical protein